MVERGGKVKVTTVEKRSKKELQKQIRENVEVGSAIFSDELLSYERLSEDFKHAVINQERRRVPNHKGVPAVQASGTRKTKVVTSFARHRVSMESSQAPCTVLPHPHKQGPESCVYLAIIGVRADMDKRVHQYRVAEDRILRVLLLNR
jgi:ISXO2 transposase-like protein